MSVIETGLLLILALGVLGVSVERAIDRQRRRKMSGYEIEQRMRWHASQQARIDRGAVQQAAAERREAQEAQWRERV